MCFFIKRLQIIENLPTLKIKEGFTQSKKRRNY